MFDFDALIPDCYRQYRPLIREALQFFMAELSAERRAVIISEQLDFEPTVTLEERLVALLKRCPTLHKIGQIMARHPQLDGGLRTQLQQLESLPPSLTIADLTGVIESELGDVARRLDLGAQALAEGSVAVVVPFVLRDAAPGEPSDGVLKILKPGIEVLIEEELGIADRFGEWIETRSSELALPPLGYREIVGQVARMLRAEICLDVERENLVQATALYAKNAQARVPRLLPFHSPRITAMERIGGRKITDDAEMTGHEQRALAQTLIQALLAQPFFNDSDSALFHGDPHAGNLLLDNEGRVVIIDWSLTGRIDRASRHAIIVILIGAFTLSRARVKQGLQLLIEGPFDESLLDIEIDRAMNSVPWSRLPGFDWLLALLDRLALAGAEFASEFTIFRKALFTLNGVFADVSDDYSIDLPLARTAVLQFYRELGPRLLNVSGQRRFGIQLTNVEMMTIGLMWPMTWSRYWFAGLEALGRRIVPEKVQTG